MGYKPEIQYVGQFYVYGSEAQQVAVESPKKKARTLLPLPNLDKFRRIYVDPAAICGIVLAMTMLVVMVMGSLQIQSAWQEFRAAKNYLETVEAENRALENKYHAAYDLAEVESIALGMGFIPASEAPHLNVNVTVPQPESEPTWWEDAVWFLEGLFA